MAKYISYDALKSKSGIMATEGKTLREQWLNLRDYANGAPIVATFRLGRYMRAVVCENFQDFKDYAGRYPINAITWRYMYEDERSNAGQGASGADTTQTGTT